jgi:hypothetical protein
VKKGEMGYYNFRAIKAERRMEISRVIMGCLRLDTFRNSLTVGQLNFARVRAKLFKTLYTTIWWTDVLRGRSTGKGSKVYQEARKIGGRLVHIGVYENWGDLLFEAYDSRTGNVYTHHATLAQVTNCIRHNHAALAGYLTSVRVNRYTSSVMGVILDRLDFYLPGEEGTNGIRKFWRTEMWNEQPRLSLNLRLEDGFRGPVFEMNRRISGRTVVAKIYKNSRGDLRAVVSKGQHGVEHSRYHGDDLSLIVDKVALRRIVRMQPGLLKPKNVVELYKFVFDKLDLVESDAECLVKQDAYQTALERERAGKERMGEALKNHTKWAKLTRAPVLRELEKIVHARDDAEVHSGYTLMMKSDIEEDDQFEVVNEASWSSSNGRNFTCRICVTDNKEFVMSVRKESKIEMYGRWEGRERSEMAREDVASKAARDTEKHIKDTAAVHYLHRMREQAVSRGLLAEMKAVRRCENLKEKYVDVLREKMAKKKSCMIANARAVCRDWASRVEMDKGGGLVISSDTQKGKIWQQRSFTHHGVSEVWKYGKETSALREGRLPFGVQDNEAYLDVGTRRLRKKQADWKLGKKRFQGAGFVVKQSRARVMFKWRVGKKVKRVQPSKRGLVEREVVVKPRIMR